MENRIKEPQLCLFSDRTRTHEFAANQLRLWFSSLAYVLMSELRRKGLQGTSFAKAQCSTIRNKLFKVGALIKIRRVYVQMSLAYPHQSLFHKIFLNLKSDYGCEFSASWLNFTRSHTTH